MKHLIFPVSVYKYKVKNWEVKKKKLLDLFNSFQHKVAGNVLTSPINIETNILSDEIKLFEKDIQVKFIPTQVWFQKYENNMDHPVHNHGPTGYSSVCFIEYNNNFHKPTTFVSPFGKCTTGEVELYQPDVEEGDIIFFPSRLLHYAPINLSNKVRIIMSFNLVIKLDNPNTNKIFYN